MSDDRSIEFDADTQERKIAEGGPAAILPQEHFEHTDLLGREGPHLARFSRLFWRFSASRFH